MSWSLSSRIGSNCEVETEMWKWGSESLSKVLLRVLKPEKFNWRHSHVKFDLLLLSYFLLRSEGSPLDLLTVPVPVFPFYRLNISMNFAYQLIRNFKQCQTIAPQTRHREKEGNETGPIIKQTSWCQSTLVYNFLKLKGKNCFHKKSQRSAEENVKSFFLLEVSFSALFALKG